MVEGSSSSIEAAATTINWVGIWSQADFEGQLRNDALAWSGDDVRRYVASGGRDAPSDEVLDGEDSPCPYTGAGAAWQGDVAMPWWVEAQNHTEGPADDESIPRKLEGWYQVLDYTKDKQQDAGDDLFVGDLCYMERLWSDRIRVFKPSHPNALGIVKIKRVCDLQLMQKQGSAVGSQWDLLRDLGEGGDDPDEIRVGQHRVLLGGEFGQMKLKGIECKVVGYVEWMDRWTVEIPFKDYKGKNQVLAVTPYQLVEPKLPRDPRANGGVKCTVAISTRALEINFCGDADDPRNKLPEKKDVNAKPGTVLIGALGKLAERAAKEKMAKEVAAGLRSSEGLFQLRIRYVSRIRPGGRVWAASEESMYKYAEVRYISQGDYGIVFRVLRMVDNTKRALDDDEEDPHMVLDIPKGSDKSAIAKAYRKLARKWHPDKQPEEEREAALEQFRRIHQAYENLQADPERSSDLMVLKMQLGSEHSKRIPVAQTFHTESKCLTLISQLKLPNVAKLVEIGPDEQFIVTWPFLPEALKPFDEQDGVRQVDRVDLVRQGWSDYTRSRKCSQRVIVTAMRLIRHDIMTVDPMQNIIIDRETGEPLFIDFGRGETAGSIYTTRIKTFLKKVLQLLVRSICKSSFDIASRFIKDIENTLFAELEKWQDEKTRDQKKALATIGTTLKWQEGIECVRDIWNGDENPFRKLFKDNPSIAGGGRALREARMAEDELDSDAENQGTKEEEDDDPDGLLEADINELTPVQRLLRQQRKRGRRAKLPEEKPNVKIKIIETLPDGTLGLGLDDADEDSRGVIVVQIHKKVRKNGWQEGDRIIEVNGRAIDDFDGFKAAWEVARSMDCAVFGVWRLGVELPPEPKVPKCLNCGAKGSHLKTCSTWKFPLPEGYGDTVYFCGADCQKEAWMNAKRAMTLGRSY